MNDGGRDFVLPRQFPGGRGFDKVGERGFPDGLGSLIPQVADHGAGRDRVHPYRREFNGQAAGQSLDGGVGRDVGGRRSGRPHAGRPGHQHDRRIGGQHRPRP